MRTPLLILTASASLVLACQSPPPKAEADPKPDAASQTEPQADDAKPACAAASLQTELGSYCEFDLGVPPIELPKVPWTAETYHPLATRVIIVDAQGLTDPEGTGTVSVEAWLADPPRRLPEPGEMVFAIAASVPATTVAELQRGLAAAGRKQVRYLVHVTDDQPIPQPRDPNKLAAMREELPKNPNEKVMFIANAIQGYAETCPPVASVFGKIAQVAPGDRCATLSELASKAIVECGCAEIDTIMTLLYALTMGLDVPKGRAATVPVLLDSQAGVVATKGATWGEVASQQFESAELHHLWLDAAAPTEN